jgi:hypothetical protein
MAVGGRTDREGEDTGGFGYGGGNGLGMDAAEVSAAGGMEMGGAAAAADLANALADALAGGDYYDPGAVAAQDLAAQQAEGVMDIEGDLLGMEEDERWEVAQAAAPATGVVEDFSGYTQAGLAPSAYAAGQKYGGEQPSVESFGQSWQTAVPDTSTPYDANEFASAQNAPNLATGPELFGGYQGAVAQGYNFDQTQQGHPDFQGVQSVGTGVEDFTGMPTGTMGQGGVSQDIGMINAGTTQDSAGTVSPSGGGMINLGTVRTDQESGDLWTGAPNQGGAITPAGGALEDQTTENNINNKVAEIAQQTNTPETNTAAHKQIAQSRLDMQTTLDQKAKADPNGRVLDKFGNKTTVTNQQLANAYRGFDTTLAAYATINGQNSLVSMIANNLPGVNMAGKMLGGLKQALIDRGIFNKTSAEDIVAMISENLAAGEQPGAGSQWGGGEGGMEAEMAVQQQVSSFIQQYPWAAELDPKYIKYLIDNPAELQDLLGQNAGG